MDRNAATFERPVKQAIGFRGTALKQKVVSNMQQKQSTSTGNDEVPACSLKARTESRQAAFDGSRVLGGGFDMLRFLGAVWP